MKAMMGNQVKNLLPGGKKGLGGLGGLFGKKKQ